MKLTLLFLLSLNLFSQDKALNAIKSLGKELKTELMNAKKISMIHALDVCHTKASEITRNAQKEGISLGRVSLKNRNPNNKPKEWMIDSINAYHKGEIKTPFVKVSISKNREGLLRPIKTMPMCIQCHGMSIKKDLKEEISKRYPEDMAFGYKVGDIRGFFWAEYDISQ